MGARLMPLCALQIRRRLLRRTRWHHRAADLDACHTLSRFLALQCRLLFRGHRQ